MVGQVVMMGFTSEEIETIKDEVDDDDDDSSSDGRDSGKNI